MKYMLDTNICIYIIANKSLNVVKKLREMAEHDISVSVIVASELAYGVAKSQRFETNKDTLELFLSSLSIEPMSDNVMWHYARLRNHLQSTGSLIGENDQWIAAHALATNAVLVTNNVSEFERVPGLSLENWV
jgi:tRNA(fMet)-specific endonuclease VapC